MSAAGYLDTRLPAVAGERHSSVSLDNHQQTAGQRSGGIPAVRAGNPAGALRPGDNRVVMVQRTGGTAMGDHW